MMQLAKLGFEMFLNPIIIILPSYVQNSLNFGSHSAFVVEFWNSEEQSGRTFYRVPKKSSLLANVSMRKEK
jgi:hypothetical protein